MMWYYVKLLYNRLYSNETLKYWNKNANLGHKIAYDKKKIEFQTFKH